MKWRSNSSTKPPNIFYPHEIHPSSREIATTPPPTVLLPGMHVTDPLNDHWNSNCYSLTRKYLILTMGWHWVVTNYMKFLNQFLMCTNHINNRWARELVPYKVGGVGKWFLEVKVVPMATLGVVTTKATVTLKQSKTSETETYLAQYRLWRNSYEGWKGRGPYHRFRWHATLEKHPRKRFQNFRQSCVLAHIGSKSTNHCH